MCWSFASCWCCTAIICGGSGTVRDLTSTPAGATAQWKQGTVLSHARRAASEQQGFSYQGRIRTREGSLSLYRRVVHGCAEWSSLNCWGFFIKEEQESWFTIRKMGLSEQDSGKVILCVCFCHSFFPFQIRNVILTFLPMYSWPRQRWPK